MLVFNTPTAPQLAIVGAVIQVQVEPPASVRQALAAQGSPIPPVQTIPALIDTGAAVTGVDANVLMQLGLLPSRTVSVQSASGSNPHGVFRVDFHIPIGPQRLSFTDRDVIGYHLAAPSQPVAPYQALIGRDILSMMMLVWYGPTGQWTLAF
jgi:hypothetical protein